MNPQPMPNDSRFQNLTGKTFGKWSVLFYAGRKNGKYSLWHCRCECGKEQTQISSALTLGRTKSCSSCFRKSDHPLRSNAEDFTGQSFGRLTVLSLDRRLKRPSRSYWLCKCSCGESVIIRGDNLKYGKAQSCGCLSVSRKWLDQPIPDTGVCRICSKTLPLNTKHFYRHPSSKHGFNLICRPCFRQQRSLQYKRESGKLRMQCLVAYAGDPPKCQCQGCDQTYLEFLTIDHINGGGAKHRREVSNVYQWLRINKFPPGFRVLCMNCNHALGKYGYCPHIGKNH